jgi:hypothetical protein
VRFPINRGKIKVNCPCGNSFIADPDSPELYKGAQFDLHGKVKKKNAVTGLGSLKERLSSFDIRKRWEQFARYAIGLSYKIQNFRILPFREQQKIIIVLSVIILLIIVFLFLMCGSPFSIAREEWG